MGYGSYQLEDGRKAGYLIEATCEHPDCTEKIHRGVSFACGGEPGDQGGCSCHGYFCAKHLYTVETLPGTHGRTEVGRCPSLCAQCVSFLAFTGQIEEADQYRAMSKFTPDSDTRAALDMEGVTTSSPYPTSEGDEQ